MKRRLPRLLVIADEFTSGPRCELVRELASAGVLPWVQLRDHHALPEDFAACARRLVTELRRVSPSTVISINGHPDLVEELGVGLHLGFRSISPVDARTKFGPDVLIGYSAHKDSHISVIAHCHYITFSPVFPVRKSPSSPPLGLDRLAYMSTHSDVPVLALGSITVERVRDCLNVGAHGVAVFSGVMGSDDPIAAARRYMDAVTAHVATANLEHGA